MEPDEPAIRVGDRVTIRKDYTDHYIGKSGVVIEIMGHPGATHPILVELEEGSYRWYKERELARPD
jgi:hypothetical protein